MKKLITTLACLLLSTGLFAQKYSAEKSNVKFFSEALLEDITATTEKMDAIVDFENSTFFFRIKINTFQFDKDLMQEHFNENYMESEQYPNGSFKGSFTPAIDPSKDGSYQVEMNGELNIHGKVQKRTIPVTINIKNGQVSFESKFMVKLEDHKVKIPKVVFQNIAEEVEVTVSSMMVPLKK